MRSYTIHKNSNVNSLRLEDITSSPILSLHNMKNDSRLLSLQHSSSPVIRNYIKGFAKPSSKHSGQFSWWWNTVGNWLNGSHKIYGSVRYLCILGYHWVFTLVRGCWTNVVVRNSWHPFCIDDLVAWIRISFIYSFRSQRVPCVVHSKKHTNLYERC